MQTLNCGELRLKSEVVMIYFGGSFRCFSIIDTQKEVGGRMGGRDTVDI